MGRGRLQVIVRRSLQRAGVDFDTLTSLFGHAAREAVPACLISDTTDDRVTRQATPQPMHCNANSSASSASHHPLRAATGTGHKRATPSGPGALLKAAASRASFFCSSLASAFYHLFVFLLLFVRHFLNSHLVSSLPSPRPQTALRSRSTDCLLWPTSPDGTRSSLLSSYPPRQSRSLAAVGRSCCWRVSFLFRAHRGGVKPGQSFSEGVCQQKAVMLSMKLAERISKKEKTARKIVIRSCAFSADNCRNRHRHQPHGRNPSVSAARCAIPRPPSAHANRGPGPAATLASNLPELAPERTQNQGSPMLGGAQWWQHG